MKRITLHLIVSLVLFSAISASAQDWNAIFKLNWKNRTRAFTEQNLDWQNVVLVGDSITEGYNVAKFFPGRRVLNRGIGGDVIGNAKAEGDPRGLLQRLDNSIFDCSPSEIFLLIGINDLQTHHTVAQMEEGYTDLLKKIRARLPMARVHVQSLLPTSGTKRPFNPQILEFNEWLKNTAPQYACDYIDLHALFSDGNGELRADCTADGLHLNDVGYKIWTDKILKVMNWN
ncbi:MAG: GDSL-type esterase/lipase family protein [Chthoniobacteraceae bacterium]